jgi:tetratricopeptide (TPR) repeat protein
VSLLLEALKKAELAKQASKPAAQAAAPLELAPSEPAVSVGAPEKPIITRQSLPEINQQLEILSADLPSSVPAPAQIEMSAAQPAAPPVRAAPEPVFAEEPVQEQAAAKQLFEAKGLEDYNPRKPFYYTVGALSVFAVGTVFYFWWQLQPRYIVAPAAVANATARPPASGSPPPPAVAAPAAPAAVDPLAAPRPDGATAGPGPVTAPTARNAPAKTAQAAPNAAKAPAAPAAIPSPVPGAAAAPANSATSPLVIARTAPASREDSAVVPPRQRTAAARAPAIMTSAMRADQHLERAYDAYQRGDLAAARQDYHEALKLDPKNRDALLGLATIAARNGEFNEAEARYLRLLEADPRDSHAMAGLIALRGQADPMQSESRLKGMIANQPEAGYLHFALGNQMAAQARWAEAQESYFKAVGSDPDSPDYAYNLAVSLDHLRQTKPALEYYQKALALGGTRPSTFDRNRAAARIRELQQ